MNTLKKTGIALGIPLATSAAMYGLSHLTPHSLTVLAVTVAVVGVIDFVLHYFADCRVTEDYGAEGAILSFTAILCGLLGLTASSGAFLGLMALMLALFEAFGLLILGVFCWVRMFQEYA